MNICSAPLLLFFNKNILGGFWGVSLSTRFSGGRDTAAQLLSTAINPYKGLCLPPSDLLLLLPSVSVLGRVYDRCSRHNELCLFQSGHLKCNPWISLMQQGCFCPELGNWVRSDGMGMRMVHSWPCFLMVSGPFSPGRLSEIHWPEMVGATQDLDAALGSPLLTYTTVTAWLSIPSKSRVKPSVFLLHYNTICWQGGRTPSCRQALNRFWSLFSSQELRPEALLSVSTTHGKGLSGTTENLCQQKSNPAQKGGVPLSVTQTPAQPAMFSL